MLCAVGDIIVASVTRHAPFQKDVYIVCNFISKVDAEEMGARGYRVAAMHISLLFWYVAVC